ncbi:MAG: GNAT family N-acetyltransferase [Rubrobacteraceae bacterium]
MRAADERVAWLTRPGGPEDVEFLRDMLYEAACWRPGASRPLRDEVLSAHENALYLEDWGRDGDTAVVALGPDGGGRIGAAWYRLMPPEDPGYGFVDASTPEVAIGVVPEFRGCGVGGALLDGLMHTARSQGFEVLSLSVEPDNLAIRLYERKGFEKLFAGDGSVTMRADLASAPKRG